MHHRYFHNVWTLYPRQIQSKLASFRVKLYSNQLSFRVCITSLVRIQKIYQRHIILSRLHAQRLNNLEKRNIPKSAFIVGYTSIQMLTFKGFTVKRHLSPPTKLTNQSRHVNTMFLTNHVRQGWEQASEIQPTKPSGCISDGC